MQSTTLSTRYQQLARSQFRLILAERRPWRHPDQAQRQIGFALAWEDAVSNAKGLLLMQVGDDELDAVLDLEVDDAGRAPGTAPANPIGE